ncbi:SMP-30/gluconolactonase/LRE family protein [Vibrio breoganii]|uniref:SMP-30/gluconolactonase/LRE family protein n=1 Tax=Vibrio breoganii TaxID=553239 RepID=UPI0010BDF0B0|nr:SMP-30/gluconolactonase/LRE family protein [Vibrio breoganii]TKF85213.1 SMP-30/gluconolactonase/LRE family protein [Vibrio breoganii]
MNSVSTLQHTPCVLGEGILWHPVRQQMFWIDILEPRLLTYKGIDVIDIPLPRTPSALGWVDKDSLLLADEVGLHRFNIEQQSLELVVSFEHDPKTHRSNDGRADPWGGFWISTMHRDAIEGEAAFYRYYQGKLTQVISNITIPNGCCFSVDKEWVYFTNSPTAQIMRMKLDKDTGWPISEPELFIDHSYNFREPDGAIVADNGDMISAHWGAGELVRYSAEGEVVDRYSVPVKQPTCPTFGGENLDVLFVTSAKVGIEDSSVNDGKTLVLTGVGKGIAEPAVLL